MPRVKSARQSESASFINYMHLGVKVWLIFSYNYYIENFVVPVWQFNDLLQRITIISNESYALLRMLVILIADVGIIILKIRINY